MRGYADSVERHTPQQHLSVKDIINNGGYYDLCGLWNSITTLDNYPGLLFRKRVEVLLLDKSSIYLHIFSDKNKYNYRVPGGSIDINTTLEDQVYREVLEETKIKSTNIQNTNYTYIKLTKDMQRYQCKENYIAWQGTINNVYVAYADRYLIHHHVDYALYDYDMDNNGQFYYLPSIYKYLNDHHKIALAKIKIIPSRPK